jgi:hypothetical protein
MPTSPRIRSCRRCREPIFPAIRLDGIRIAIDANPVRCTEGLGLVTTEGRTVAVPVKAADLDEGWVYSQHECRRRSRPGVAVLRRVK